MSENVGCANNARAFNDDTVLTEEGDAPSGELESSGKESLSEPGATFSMMIFFLGIRFFQKIYI